MIAESFFAWLDAHHPGVAGNVSGPDSQGNWTFRTPNDPAVQAAIDLDPDFIGTLTAFYAPEELKIAKAAKDGLIEAERDRKMAVCPYEQDGEIFQIKADPQWVQFMDATERQLEKGDPRVLDSFPREWDGAIGDKPILTAAQFQEMATEVWLHSNEIYGIAKTHRITLAKLTTLEDVETFPIWPEL